MRIIVTGGGTGGHIFPALEIIKELKKKPDMDVVWAGNANSFEEKTALDNHITFFALGTKKIVGQGFFKKITALFALLVAVIQCLQFLLKQRPQAVIGVGGYVSAPLILASFLLGIRRYIAEQNVVPGLANRYLGKIATKVFMSFHESQRYFPKGKTILTGNPVRADFFGLARTQKPEALRILITGGSMGAQFINKTIPEALAELHGQGLALTITHQTGHAMVADTQKTYENLGLRAHVTPFIAHMPHAFIEHDLIISRAGATIIAELTASGTPSILIPYPFALGHQQKNAEVLVDKKAAIMILQGPDAKSRLVTTLKNIYSDRSILHHMAQQALSLGIPHAASNMVQCILTDIA